VSRPDPKTGAEVNSYLLTAAALPLQAAALTAQLEATLALCDANELIAAEVRQRCDKTAANRDVSGWAIAHEAVFATPADSPRHDGTPYRELRVRRWGLGVIHRSRALLLPRRAQPET
jgi:hypothetical protein